MNRQVVDSINSREQSQFKRVTQFSNLVVLSINPTLEATNFFFMFNSTAHDLYPSAKCYIANNCFGILTFISRINTTSNLRVLVRTFFNFEHFSFYEHLKCHIQLR